MLAEPTHFPLLLPRPTAKTADQYERAFRTATVGDFFSRLRALSLVDPGYGHEGIEICEGFATALGRHAHCVESLKVLGFEDGALALFLPRLAMPRLRMLQIVGNCHTATAQRAVLHMLHRHCAGLEELELNIFCEFLLEAEDPLGDIGICPNVRRLTVRALAPMPLAWEEFAEKFPALEELTLVYHQDFALNAFEDLEDFDEFIERDFLPQRASSLYHDAVVLARNLHEGGFQRLANECKYLKRIDVTFADTSFGYDMTPSEDRFMIRWNRSYSSASLPFRRDSEQNRVTRSALEQRSHVDFHRGLGVDASEEDRIGGVTEEQAMAFGSAMMLQLARHFDDPSLEAQLGVC